jgi:hypothetical protein
MIEYNHTSHPVSAVRNKVNETFTFRETGRNTVLI